MEISEHDVSGDYKQLVEGTQWKNDELQTQHLKLDISDSFLSSIRLMLTGYRNDSNQTKNSDRSRYEELQTAQDQLISDKKGKIVPTELPLLTLCIGNKKFIRTDECDIFAKFCYLAKKVVCQMHNGTLSRKVNIPFSDITSLQVCFDHGGFDALRIEAKVSLKSFCAHNTRPGKFPSWKVEDPEDADRFPKSKFVFLEIEKGVLEKGFAKLLNSDPRLERVVNFSRGTSSDQRMHHGHVNAQMQQANTSALNSLSSNIVFPYIGG